MKRRNFLGLLGGTVAAAPLTAKELLTPAVKQALAQPTAEFTGDTDTGFFHNTEGRLCVVVAGKVAE